MSYCALVLFKNNKPIGELKFSNSWRGASLIWTALYDSYIKDPLKDYDNWLINEQGLERLWNLWRSDDLEYFESVVLLATLDGAIIKKENFKQFAKDLRLFVKKYNLDKGWVSHLTGWAKVFDESDCEAIGFYHTSVSENPWYTRDERKEEEIPVDLRKNKKWFSVYKEMEESYLDV